MTSASSRNVVLAGGGQLVTGVGLITVSGKINNKSLQVSVPPARLIPPGVSLQIDGGKGQKIDYLMCMPDRCVAQIRLTDAMVASLKKGTDLVSDLDQLLRRAPNPIKISLEGFTGAIDGEPVSASSWPKARRACRTAC